MTGRFIHNHLLRRGIPAARGSRRSDRPGVPPRSHHPAGLYVRDHPLTGLAARSHGSEGAREAEAQEPRGDCVLASCCRAIMDRRTLLCSEWQLAKQAVLLHGDRTPSWGDCSRAGTGDRASSGSVYRVAAVCGGKQARADQAGLRPGHDRGANAAARRRLQTARGHPAVCSTECERLVQPLGPARSPPSPDLAGPSPCPYGDGRRRRLPLRRAGAARRRVGRRR